MMKGGETNRYEPIDTMWENVFPDCAALFQRDEWFNFFERIKFFNPEVTYHFAQGLIKDTVTFDALKFELTEELIAEATCIARYGEMWFK